MFGEVRESVPPRGVLETGLNVGAPKKFAGIAPCQLERALKDFIGDRGALNL